jgi:hypothetical protein
MNTAKLLQRTKRRKSMNFQRHEMSIPRIARLLTIALLVMVQGVNAAEQPSSANQKRTSGAVSEWTTNASGAASTASSQVHQATLRENRFENSAKEPSPGQITTRAGKTYHNVEVIRADPDGIVIQYRPNDGGLGLAKLKFGNLPDELRNQYDYDPEHAAAFEEAQLKANALQRTALAERSEAFSHYRALAMLNRSLAGDSFTLYSISTQPDGRMTAQGSTGNTHPYAYPWSMGAPNGAYLTYPYQSASAMPPDPSAILPNKADSTASVNRKHQNSPTIP